MTLMTTDNTDNVIVTRSYIVMCSTKDIVCNVIGVTGKSWKVGVEFITFPPILLQVISTLHVTLKIRNISSETSQ